MLNPYYDRKINILNYGENKWRNEIHFWYYVILQICQINHIKHAYIAKFLFYYIVTHPNKHDFKKNKSF